jgi:hypothetical protein
MSQKWYQSSKGKVKVVWVALPGRGGGRGRYKLVSEHNGSRMMAEKRDCSNRGFGTARFEVGSWDLFGRRRILHNRQIWRKVHED